MDYNSELEYWKPVGEKYEIYHSFRYETTDPNARIRVFVHERINGNKRKIGEMILIIWRDRWAGLRGIDAAPASEELSEVVGDKNCAPARRLLDEAENKLEDFVRECAESKEIITKEFEI